MKVAARRALSARLWRGVHNVVAHPLMEVLPMAWGDALHDWTAGRAFIEVGVAAGGPGKASLRHEKTWRMARNAEGRVVLHLEELFLYGEKPDGGRYALTTVTLAEPLGSALWASVHEQRDAVVEKALAEGARVAGLDALPQPRADSGGGA